MQTHGFLRWSFIFVLTAVVAVSSPACASEDNAGRSGSASMEARSDRAEERSTGNPDVFFDGAAAIDAPESAATAAPLLPREQTPPEMTSALG